jgi:hypothetical protein
MAVAYRSGSTAGDATGTNLTINKPAGVAAGDILLCLTYREAGAWTLPAGWSWVDSEQSANVGALRLGLACRRAGASEPASYTFNLSASTWRILVMGAWSGCPTSGFPWDVYTSNTGTTSTLAANAITTTVANTMLVVGATSGTGSNLSAGSSGMTQRAELGGHEFFEEAQAAAGSTGTQTLSWGGSNSAWATWHLALKPDAGTGGSISDPFTRVDGAIGSNWTTLSGGWEVVGNKARQTFTGSYFRGARWAGLALSSSNYAVQCVVTVPSEANVAAGVGARYADAALSGYVFIGGAGGVGLYRLDSGTPTVLGTYVDASFTAGATKTLRLEVEGSSLRAYIDGTQRITATDATYSSGSPGLAHYMASTGGTYAAMDDWTATDLVAAGGAEQNLTATGIATGAPTVGTPALGQTHVLTATGITASPTVGAPALGQTHALTATGIATGAPSVGTPALGLIVALSATGTATGAPTVGAPAIGQTHVLTASSVATGAGSVGAPAIGQTHALAAAGVATSAPTVGSPAIGQTHALLATGISTGAPTVGTPSMAGGATHDLLATGIVTGAPTVGTPAIGQTHALSAAAVATNAPEVGSPAIGQVHVLGAAGIAAGAPVLSPAQLAQVHLLIAVAVALGAPTVGAPLLVNVDMSVWPPPERMIAVAREVRRLVVGAEARVQTVSAETRRQQA